MNDNKQSDPALSVDEQFRSIMEGLRTTLPGAQVLVAFLLIVPFQNEFESLTGPERAVYFIAIAAGMLSSVLLIAPSVHQRMRSPLTGVQRNTRSHLDAAVRLSIAGTISLLIALLAVAYLVTALVYETTAAICAAVVLGLTAGYSWIYQPLIAFER